MVLTATHTPDADAPFESHLTSLRASLQALAAAGAEQLALFGDNSKTGESLASDYERVASLILSRYASDLSASQADALTALSQRLSTMSRDGAEFDPDLWTDAALSGSVHWADVRRLAAAALEAFAS
jgi:hypothetical protein